MPKEEKTGFKSGFVTLIGRSNTGKSTLLNSIIGTKLSAVTHKPQTTRGVIHGVLNTEKGQAVFIDTPGILKDKGNQLSGKLEDMAKESLNAVDLAIYVVDPAKSIGAEERFVVALLRKCEIPKILVINKCDLPVRERPYLEDYHRLAKEENFDAVFELSAIYNRHVQPLRDKVFELLPVGEAMYLDDQITNLNKEQWIAEIIREKIFLALRKEVPYTTHVEVEKVDEKEGLIIIDAIIYTSQSKYKKMIIGAKGRAIKEIGIAARKELEVALNSKVYLQLDVQTDRRWDERI